MSRAVNTFIDKIEVLSQNIGDEVRKLSQTIGGKSDNYDTYLPHIHLKLGEHILIYKDSSLLRQTLLQLGELVRQEGMKETKQKHTRLNELALFMKRKESGKKF